MASKAPVKKNLSAIKKARQAEKKNERNRMERSKLRSAVKAVEVAVKGKDQNVSAEELRKATKVISSAKSKGIIHKNNASRKISRLTKLVNAATKSATA